MPDHPDTTDAPAPDRPVADASTATRSTSGGADRGASTTGLPDAVVARLRRRLLDFFDSRARDLPWRRTDDPYAIWVSEIMLQQTRVSTVVPYFERWMERYPDVLALADAGQDEVLKSWEGLGYYRRARMLHRAAGVVRDHHDGVLPDTAEELRTLPGIGPYTAGAVASIAFGRVQPAVDGNVRRVLARLLDLPEPAPAELRELAARLVDPERPGDFNQALMELGATVCTPSSPDCPACPVEDTCCARARGVQEDRPLPKRRAETPERVFAVAIPLLGESEEEALYTVLVQRPADGLLGGLWEFPTRQISDRAGTDASEDGPFVRALHSVDGFPIDVEGATIRHLPTVHHTYSHFRGVYRAALAEWAVPGRLDPDDARSTAMAGADAGREGHAVRVVRLAAIEEYPLPVVQQKILALVRKTLSGEG